MRSTMITLAAIAGLAAVAQAAPIDRVRSNMVVSEYKECKENQYTSRRKNRECDGGVCSEPIQPFQAGQGSHRVCINYPAGDGSFKLRLLKDGEVVKEANEGDNQLTYSGDRSKDYSFEVEGEGAYDIFYTAPLWDSCDGFCGGAGDISAQAPSGCYCGNDCVSLFAGESLGCCADYLDVCPLPPTQTSLNAASHSTTSSSAETGLVVGAWAFAGVAVSGLVGAVVWSRRQDRLAKDKAQIEANQA